MKYILAITLFSLMLSGCAIDKDLKSKSANTENIDCNPTLKEKEMTPLTNGIEVPSTRKYYYTWQLEKEDGTVLINKTGVSKHTKYVSWPEGANVIIKDVNTKDSKTLSSPYLYKFTNKYNFSVQSEMIQVKSSFYLEQNENNLYISMTNNYLFKETSYLDNGNKVPKDTELYVSEFVKLKPNETVVRKIASPYHNDVNKFYNIKLTINVLN